MRSCKVAACAKRVNALFFGKSRAASRNVLNAAPGLDAKIGGLVLVPKDEVIKSVKFHLYASVAHLADKRYAVAFNAAENERIQNEVAVIENKAVAFIHDALGIVGQKIAV